MRNVGRSVGPILTLGQKHQRGVIRRARATLALPAIEEKQESNRREATRMIRISITAAGV
jgi:hypothetical protein